VASGDPDRVLTNTTAGGNAPNTPDNAFNGFGLVSTGLAFGAPVSNLAIFRAGASCFPLATCDTFRRLQVGMDVYWFNKCQANAPNTPDNAFNAFGLVSTGLAFGAPVSNLAILRAGASCFPFTQSENFRRLQVGMDVYWFNKCQADAPIDESTNPATYLGWEPDFYINWEVVSDLTLTFRYGLFNPNLKAFGNDKARQFLYTGAVIAF
jgi:hypothetical protein